MGGFGGSMKNIAIGCVSGQVGKRQVHGVAGEPPAAEPTIPDIGILASTDILTIDQASVDVERIESRHGLHQLQAMKDLKMGNPQYELITIDT